MSNQIGYMYSVWSDDVEDPNDESLSTNEFNIKFQVRDVIVHDNPEEEDGGHLTFCVEEYGSVAEEISFMIRRDNLLCTEQAWFSACPWLFLIGLPQEYHSSIMNDVYKVAASMASEPGNADRKILPMVVYITSLWSYPTQPSEDEDRDEDEDEDEEDEEDEYEEEDENIAQVSSLSMDEYWMQQVVPATMASIKELEKVERENFDSCDICTICLEEFSTQVEVRRMPCSHLFHGDCIVHWLETSHFCPLCRFEMPVDPS